MRLGGRGTGWGAASGTQQRLSLGENQAGSSAPFSWSGVRSDQAQPPGRCPTAGGATSNSNRRAGPGTKGYINSVHPARAACGELRQIRSGSIPSRETLGRANQILRVCPGNRDRAPRFLWPETLDKSQTTQSLSQAPEPQERAYSTPLAIFPKVLTKTATPSPATSASVPG